ncbi:hypothetical protein Lal_00048896 [Lupinus albus]|nr:hypothetical protein Lal_00048896 [Lupinus albus]
MMIQLLLADTTCKARDTEMLKPSLLLWIHIPVQLPYKTILRKTFCKIKRPKLLQRYCTSPFMSFSSFLLMNKLKPSSDSCPSFPNNWFSNASGTPLPKCVMLHTIAIINSYCLQLDLTKRGSQYIKQSEFSHLKIQIAVEHTGKKGMSNCYKRHQGQFKCSN